MRTRTFLILSVIILTAMIVFGQEEVKKVDNYQRAMRVVQLALSACWNSSGQNPEVNYETTRAFDRYESPVEWYLQCAIDNIRISINLIKRGSDGLSPVNEEELK